VKKYIIILYILADSRIIYIHFNFKKKKISI